MSPAPETDDRDRDHAHDAPAAGPAAGPAAAADAPAAGGRPADDPAADPAAPGASRPLPSADGLVRVVASIVVDELRFQRGEDLAADAARWTAATELAGPAIRGDSLELIGLAARVTEAFHLHECGLDAALRERPTLGGWAVAAADALARPGARTSFLTSGSTGEPKRCTHAVADLGREVAALADRFAGRRRVVATVPAHHIYGFLFTVMLPAALGIEVVEARGLPGSAVRRELRAGDLVVSFPLGWDELGRAVGEPPPADVRGTCSTAPCPPAVIEQARAAGFGPITEVYGSSETGGIGWRDDPAEAYELMPHRDRADVAATAMDRLRWEDERRFRVLGRRDRVVQVGGVNVLPDRVASVLREHPGVAAAAVRLMRPDEGARLKAFVVPADAAGRGMHDGTTPAATESLRRALDAWCAERLDAPSRPRAIRVGPSLPVTDAGKAADWDAFPAAADEQAGARANEAA